MYLFFDTETTGLPNNWNAPSSDTRNWPRMVQLAYLLYTPNGELTESHNHIIKPKDFTIPAATSQIHGITTERALSEGTELKIVLTHFHALTERSILLIAHNMAFDEKIVGCEFYRLTKKDPLTGKPKFCTMKTQKIINHCAIPPFRYGAYKWPALSELHSKLFRTNFNEAHNASVDIQATARCYFELKKRGII